MPLLLNWQPSHASCGSIGSPDAQLAAVEDSDEEFFAECLLEPTEAEATEASALLALANAEQQQQQPAPGGSAPAATEASAPAAAPAAP